MQSSIKKRFKPPSGDKGAFVVSPDAIELGQKFLEQRNQNKEVRIGVISQQAKQSQEAIMAEPSALELSIVPEAKMLLDCVELNQEVSAAASSLLAGVLLVDTLEQALKLSREGTKRELIVTLAGEAVTPWGWFTTTGARAEFSHARRIEEINLLINDAQAELDQLSKDVEQLEIQESAVEEKLTRLSERRQELDSLRRNLNQILQKERAAREEMQQEIRREEKRLRDEAMQAEREAQLSVQNAAAEVSKRVSQLAFIEERIFVLGSEVQDIAKRRTDLAGRKDELISLTQKHQSILNTPSSELEQARNEVQSHENHLVAIEESRQGIASKHATLAQEVSELRRELESAKNKINKATLAVEKSVLELDMIYEELESGYGSESLASVKQTVAEQNLDEVPELDSEIEELREAGLKLRKRLEREGEVDPESIQRHEEESARLDNLRTQAQDLSQAVTLLERTIKRLKELSRERFLFTFNDVSRRFEELVPRLFGGGAGHMELVNPEDPLTSGVEITVRPPGKKLSSMELLSGGEKALVATAVLVAMFLHRPSPICVLDEVDAPLDEANLDRFISLVSEISSSTQFLIITHNKATMSAMGRLVGITMQERGVSTALSVTLDEAEEELERWVANA